MVYHRHFAAQVECAYAGQACGGHAQRAPNPTLHHNKAWYGVVRVMRQTRQEKHTHTHTNTRTHTRTGAAPHMSNGNGGGGTNSSWKYPSNTSSNVPVRPVQCVCVCAHGMCTSRSRLHLTQNKYLTRKKVNKQTGTHRSFSHCRASLSFRVWV